MIIIIPNHSAGYLNFTLHSSSLVRLFHSCGANRTHLVLGQVAIQTLFVEVVGTSELAAFLTSLDDLYAKPTTKLFELVPLPINLLIGASVNYLGYPLYFLLTETPRHVHFTVLARRLT